MSANPIDRLVLDDDWSDLARLREMPQIDFERMARYRMARIKQQLELHDAALVLLVNPISLRYAVISAATCCSSRIYLKFTFSCRAMARW